MEFIGEEIIDGVVERLSENPEVLDNIYKELAAEQPVIIALLYSKDLKSLTNKETDLLFFIIAVIYESVKAKLEEVSRISREAIEKADDENWDKMMSAAGGNFRDRITPFFEDYPQEDLLAFVEDVLLDDDDQIVSGIGREAIFITCKTVIDGFSYH